MTTLRTFRCATASAVARDDCGAIGAACRTAASPPRIDNRDSDMPADGGQCPGQVADPSLPSIPEGWVGVDCRED